LALTNANVNCKEPGKYFPARVSISLCVPRARGQVETVLTLCTHDGVSTATASPHIELTIQPRPLSSLNTMKSLKLSTMVKYRYVQWSTRPHPSSRRFQHPGPRVLRSGLSSKGGTGVPCPPNGFCAPSPPQFLQIIKITLYIVYPDRRDALMPV